MFQRWRAKRRLMKGPLPAQWMSYVADAVAQWKYLHDDERVQLLDDMRSLLAGAHWEGAKGFVLTDEIKVSIAAQAALLVLGLDDVDPYRNVGTIIVHPTTMRFAYARAGPIAGTVTHSPMSLLGLAQYDGPIVIAWDEVRANARHPERGHNVVYHEFAHKLDMLDGVVDGTPPMSDRAALARWAEVCSAEFEALREREDPDPLLDDYATVDVGEFFAVVTELFFDVPLRLLADKPELYDVLREFYGQDPAARVNAGPRDVVNS